MKLKKVKLERQKRTWADILLAILNRLFPVETHIDVYNNVDPRIHEDLGVRRIDTMPSPVTRQLEQHTDPKTLGMRHRVLEHQKESVTQELQRHVGLNTRHHHRMIEQKRFVTGKLSMDEATKELEAMPKNPRFNAMMHDDSWLNDRKIS
jgi:hypothetical protein